MAGRGDVSSVFERMGEVGSGLGLSTAESIRCHQGVLSKGDSSQVDLHYRLALSPVERYERGQIFSSNNLVKPVTAYSTLSVRIYEPFISTLIDSLVIHDPVCRVSI
jgi:hypothetical protein